MPRGLELVTGFVTAPGATLTALTMAAGNSATVRSAKEGSGIWLLEAWTDNQAAGTFRIRSPRLHDSAQGIRLDAAISDASPLLPMGFKQRLFSQDALTLELSGSAVVGDIETAALLVYYEDVPGIEARFITPEVLMARGVNIMGVENTLSLGTLGGYSGEEAINAEFDNWKANTDYALLGYLVDTECAAVRWRGVDSGNFGVGGPGKEDGRFFTNEWFLRLSRLTGLALIPVFNAANKNAILIDGAQDENGADTTVISLFVELSPGAAR
ncbi:MAG: hypothetical protein ACRD2K_03840 [Terriglobales bacterium]